MVICIEAIKVGLGMNSISDGSGHILLDSTQESYNF